MIDRQGAGPGLNGRCHELVIMPHSWAVCVCVKKERKKEKEEERFLFRRGGLLFLIMWFSSYLMGEV